MIERKLNRFKYEIRTQPISTTIAAILLSLAVAKCTLPEADAAPMVEIIEVADIGDLTESTPIIDESGPKGHEDTSVNFTAMGKGSKVGPLMGAYLGMEATKIRPAIIPATMNVNWGDNLRNLWDKKLNKKNVTPATIKNADKIVNGYTDAPRDTKTIQAFVSEVGEITRNTHASINYTTLCDAMKINETKCNSYRRTMGRFNGLNIVAYGMTEIFPAHNGRYNVATLDTILRHAGENYIDAIPALGDGLLSKGMYQFTSHAVRRDNTAVGGANFVDNHAGMKLPGSVLYLNGDNSHKAAFEFAAYNIGMVVRRLNDREANILATKCDIEQITEVIASGHHMPARTYDNAKRWIAEGCAKPYRTYAGPHLTEYALKTSINYEALKKFL